MYPFKKVDYEQKEFTEEEIEKIKKNSEEMDWSDFLAMTIAGLQLLIPMVILLIISCTVVALLFMFIWG